MNNEFIISNDAPSPKNDFLGIDLNKARKAFAPQGHLLDFMSNAYMLPKEVVEQLRVGKRHVTSSHVYSVTRVSGLRTKVFTEESLKKVNLTNLVGGKLDATHNFLPSSIQVLVGEPTVAGSKPTAAELAAIDWKNLDTNPMLSNGEFSLSFEKRPVFPERSALEHFVINRDNMRNGEVKIDHKKWLFSGETVDMEIVAPEEITGNVYIKVVFYGSMTQP